MVWLFWSAANMSITAYPGCSTGQLYPLSAEGRAALKAGMCLHLALQPENTGSFSYPSCFSVLRGARRELSGAWFIKRSVAKYMSSVLVARWHLGLIKWSGVTWAVWSVQDMVCWAVCSDCWDNAITLRWVLCLLRNWVTSFGGGSSSLCTALASRSLPLAGCLFASFIFNCWYKLISSGSICNYFRERSIYM